MTLVRKNKVTYWTATGIIFLFEGVMPALTSHTDLAIEGIRHLGYPSYFGVMLTVFKVAGAIVLILPFVKGKLKEWAYAGFAFTTIAAFISHWVVDGFSGQTLLPLLILAILITSYIHYLKLETLYHRQSLKSEKYVISSLPQ
ncbi:DoxX family protein [Pontibacter sp. H249]|uniref:DoxX family protein n=1 Tax=Pontibacter sp. H249 TaxID=3133420 RepID=UPI0030C576C6